MFDPGDEGVPSRVSPGAAGWRCRLTGPPATTGAPASIDRKAMPASFGIWRASESGMIRRFEQAGVFCQRVVIDPDELALFAGSNGMVVDAACRLAFAEWTMRAETGLDAGAGERDFPRTIHTV